MYSKNNTFEPTTNKDDLKFWIAELTDLTPQQIEAVVENSILQRSQASA